MIIALNSIALLVVMFYTYWRLDKISKEISYLESDIQDIHNYLTVIKNRIDQMEFKAKQKSNNPPRKKVIQG